MFQVLLPAADPCGELFLAPNGTSKTQFFVCFQSNSNDLIVVGFKSFPMRSHLHKSLKSQQNTMFSGAPAMQPGGGLNALAAVRKHPK